MPATMIQSDSGSEPEPLKLKKLTSTETINTDITSCSGGSSPDGKNVMLDYYKLSSLDKDLLFENIKKAVSAMGNLQLHLAESPVKFIDSLFGNSDMADFLINLSRLPVFSYEFAQAMKHDLDLLACVKKLKYFTNLSLSQNAILLARLANCLGSPVIGMKEQIARLFKEDELAKMHVKDYMKQSSLGISRRYLDNDVALEKLDPHAVYPTSIYRQCDGCTMATADSQTIEAIMSTNITTTIKITRKVLDPSNLIMAELYKPLGRCVAVIDDKVERLFGEQIQAYFDAHEIELIKLIHSGNEIDKDIENVRRVLVDMKTNGVARNEPVLIVGGGVIADIGGLATALYHRNTPYVMLCTSIVSGIDAGPSPRTCCDGYGFKNIFGSYHPPVMTLTDRAFWRTLPEGCTRHGIAEIIKMACVKDGRLFELLEKAGDRLIYTKFGTVGCDDDLEFQDLCDEIVGRAMKSYVQSEYGNLWETHQCRPHAFGHTWSPGYELPAGMLHGHAVATCMGYGSYLAYKKNWINKEKFQRILKLISDMELSLWHPIMDNHDMVIAANKKVVDKRGGNLCAPVPKNEIGECGYINDLTNEDIPITLNEYKAIAQKMPRNGLGVEAHCADVGLDDPSARAQQAFADINQAPTHAADSHDHSHCSHSHDHSHSHDSHDHSQSKAQKNAEIRTTYKEWISAWQENRNSGWEMNVHYKVPADTAKPMKFEKMTLFHDGVEKYALDHTTVQSKNIQNASNITQDKEMFMPCMVGSVESQFLKMMCLSSNAKRCLDIGTFTGMSALAMAEGIPEDGKVVTLECYEDTAAVAQRIFNESNVAKKIELKVGQAAEHMKKMMENGEKFDLIFIDADKENYVEYYELALDLLNDDGIILADNSLCALLYDQETDIRSLKLHEFNQHVKNDPRTEQVVLTVREGVTFIRKVNH